MKHERDYFPFYLPPRNTCNDFKWLIISKCQLCDSWHNTPLCFRLWLTNFHMYCFSVRFTAECGKLSWFIIFPGNWWRIINFRSRLHANIWIMCSFWCEWSPQKNEEVTKGNYNNEMVYEYIFFYFILFFCTRMYLCCLYFRFKWNTKMQPN